MKVIASLSVIDNINIIFHLYYNHEDNQANFRELHRVWSLLSNQFGALALEQFKTPKRSTRTLRRRQFGALALEQFKTQSQSKLYFVLKNPPSLEGSRAIMTQQFNALRISEEDDWFEEWEFEL